MAFVHHNFTTTPASYYPGLPTLDFETKFDHRAAMLWFHQYWPLGFVFCFIYIVLIYLGQRWMEHRERFQLKTPLTLWSLSLAIFSLISTLRMWSEGVYIVNNYGWHSTACDPVWMTSVSGFWGWLFTWSKLIEFGDTAFIVLRKQKLVFLHWYHHVTVLMYTWYSYSQAIGPSRYFGVLNVTAHTFMYFYYTVKASKLFPIPKPVSVFITLFQILQMVVGMTVNIYALYALIEQYKCSTTYENILVAFLMYLSYFLLFVHYFYNAYFTNKQKPLTNGAVIMKNNNYSNGLNAEMKKKEL